MFELRRPRDEEPITARPLKVLACGPHVDDIEIGCGATLLWLKRYQAAEIHVRVFSDHYTKPHLQLRSQEAEATVPLMGYDSLKIHEYEDTGFPEERRAIQTRVEGLHDELQPDLVLSPNASDTHQDHVTLAQAIQREFRSGQSIWEYEINQFGVTQHFTPTLFVDVGLATRSRNEEFLKTVAKRSVGASPVEDTLAHEKIHVLQQAMRTQRQKLLLQPHILLSVMSLRALQASRFMRFAEAFKARTILHTGTAPPERPA